MEIPLEVVMAWAVASSTHQRFSSRFHANDATLRRTSLKKYLYVQTRFFERGYVSYVQSSTRAKHNLIRRYMYHLYHCFMVSNSIHQILYAFFDPDSLRGFFDPLTVYA